MKVCLDADEVVCHCAGVGRASIQAVIDAEPGATLASLGDRLGCGVQCGTCRPVVRDLLGQSPWYDVVHATRTTLTRGRDPERRIVRFDLQLASGSCPRALPAQHVVVQAWLGDRWVTRTYTVVEHSADGRRVSIAIRRIAGGQFSAPLIDAADDAFARIPLRLAAPYGEPAPDDDRPAVGFVAGVGVTVAMGLLGGARPGRALHIDYSATSRGDQAFVERLEAAAAEGRVTCQLRTDEVDGLITAEDVQRTVARFSGARFYVCGPLAYSRLVRAALSQAGVAEGDVLVEDFHRTPTPRPTPRPTRRRAAYALGLVAACVPLLLLGSGFAGYVPHDEYVPGHEDLACDACHRKAPGTIRQQLRAKAQHLVGLRDGGADFGMRPIDNRVCGECHDNPNDRHPSYRFLEPRFEEARTRLAPQECRSCHREHTGVRVSQTDVGFCAACHGDVKVDDDPTRPTHVWLATAGRWDTCLTCHDFHGNHAHDPPEDLDAAIAPPVLAGYLQGAESSPFGERTIKARKPEVSP